MKICAKDLKRGDQVTFCFCCDLCKKTKRTVNHVVLIPKGNDVDFVRIETQERPCLFIRPADEWFDVSNRMYNLRSRPV